MTERNGLSGWLLEKKKKKPLKDSDKCVMPLVIPAHLGERCVCVAESIESEQKWKPSRLRGMLVFFCARLPACTFKKIACD